jgi:hypothetical protein
MADTPGPATHTVATHQMAGRLFFLRTCGTPARSSTSLVHNFLLQEPDGLFGIAVQPNAQGLLKLSNAQMDDGISACVHGKPRGQFTFGVAKSLT